MAKQSTPKKSPATKQPQQPQPATLPATGFVRLPLLKSLLGVCGATIWRWSRENTNGFPSPVKLTNRVTAWKAEAVREWIEKQGQAET